MAKAKREAIFEECAEVSTALVTIIGRFERTDKEKTAMALLVTATVLDQLKACCADNAAIDRTIVWLSGSAFEMLHEPDERE